MTGPERACGKGTDPRGRVNVGGRRVAPHPFGGIEYRLHKREIGHVHGDRLVDLPFPKQIRDELVAAGLAQHIMFFRRAAW
jgi:hypothetical protein